MEKNEICEYCENSFDINKRDNSGYKTIEDKSGHLQSIPVCAACREDEW